MSETKQFTEDDKLLLNVSATFFQQLYFGYIGTNRKRVNARARGG
jgi:hypothetical protein